MVEFLIGFVSGCVFTFVVFVVWGVNQLNDEEKENDKHEDV